MIEGGHGIQRYHADAVDSGTDYRPWVLVMDGDKDTGDESEDAEGTADDMTYHIEELFAICVVREVAL